MAEPEKRRGDDGSAQGARGVGVGWLLLGVNGLVVLMPVFALVGLKIYENHLVRQTETGLIGQAVVLGEAWRERYLEELGEGAEISDIAPPGAGDGEWYPVEPTLDLSEGVTPPLNGPSRTRTAPDGPALRAGEAVRGILARAKRFNLSSARILDEQGCTLVGTGEWEDGCFDDYEEIRQAVAGRYASAARDRKSDEPKPSFSSISRRGDVRVFVALPVFIRGEVAAVVWMSRTSMAPLKAAWLYRRPITAGLILIVLVTGLVSLFLSRAITNPLKRITSSAREVAAGRGSRVEPSGGFSPREVRQLERALAKMTRQLSERADYIAGYAANITHELKSPITAIRGAAELLAEEADEMSPDQRGRFIANIRADAERMERLVTRLLVLARIESEAGASSKVNVRSFVEQVAEAYGEKVELSWRDPPAEIEINPDHLESALRNLLDNAVEHGGGRAKVTVGGRYGRLAVTVADDGPGISAPNREHVFERFFTTNRDNGGTGLGLAIVQAVAHARGGDVALETGDRGTTFTLVM